MAEQILFRGESGYLRLEEYLISLGCRKLLLVCGKSLSSTAAGAFFDRLHERSEIAVIRFSVFSPNPDYCDVVNGVKAFRENGCDAVCGAGGGSAIDTAKCIKLFADMPDETEYIRQRIVPNNIPLIAVPTTAGTGSEATRFAVIYRDGEKLSVYDDSCLPEAVLLDPGLLDSLPDMHRKAAMLDALCHAVESLWSVRSDEESSGYSRRALRMIISSMDGYLRRDEKCSEIMLEAAHIAGKAINITTTTAAHAMCYKLTKLYGIPHGHAVSLCLPEVYRFLTENCSRCSDELRALQLRSTLDEIPELLGCGSYDEALAFLTELPENLGLEAPSLVSDGDIGLLCDSVNTERLSNTPVIPSKDEIKEMYLRIFGRS